jgi:glycine cleavage system regulatory protein
MNRAAKVSKQSQRPQKKATRAVKVAKVAKVTKRSITTTKKAVAKSPVSKVNTMTRRAFTAEIDASAVPTRRPTVLNHSLVLMCSGPDDKDVLPLIAQTVTKLSGSIEESRMTCLGADFTVSTLLTIPMTVSPQTVEQDILSALPDFTVACRLTSPAPASSSYEPAKILALDVEGPDQPKIVTTFAQTLYRHNVAIKDVITDTSSAPFLGYNVFAMKAVVSIPLKTDMKQLEADLQTFEAQFGLNLAVSDPAEQQQQQQPGAPGQQPQH